MKRIPPFRLVGKRFYDANPWFYYNVLDYDTFKNKGINWDEKYSVPSNDILGNQVYTHYDQRTNNYISNFQMNMYELNLAENDPRWLSN